MRWILGAAATASLLLAASSVPAFSADGGTVSASVTAATPCITLSIPPLDFGTLPFSTATTGSSKNLSSPGSYTNCSVQSQTILLRGTNASNAGGAAWTLNAFSSCTVDSFSSDLNIPTGGIEVATTDRVLPGGVAAGATTTIVNIGLFMPCTGSSGAGTTMSWQYIFTATF